MDNNITTTTSELNIKEEIQINSKFSQEFRERFDDLEGIIGNEPPKNKYETVKFHKLNIFPYFLIGKVQSKFEINGHDKYLNGVGILIGPDILLTVAHNIVTMVDNEVLESKRIYFFPAANGDFTTFDNVKSIKTYVNEEYIEALKNNDRLAQINNDWGLVYLSSAVGLEISTLFGINETYSYYLKVNDDRLYSYFTYNDSLDMQKLQSISEKISIVGYTECKNQYKDNAMYRFRKNFTTTERNENYNEENININIKITNDNNVVATEGLISNSRFNPNQSKNLQTKNMEFNGSDYIIFGNDQYNKDSKHSEAEKLVMSESKGNLIPNEEKFIKYNITTYKGQSGSPIFLRVKKLTGKDIFTDKDQTERKHVYIYHFIGLHSRRGPSNEELGQKGFLETESGDINDLVRIDNKVSDTKVTTCNSNSSDELVKIHGMCDYNIALSIIGNCSKKISTAVKELNLQNSYPNTLTPKLNSNFILVKFLMNDEEKLTGLFKKTTTLEIIFTIGSKILNIPKEYVLIRDISNQDLSDVIQNYNYDNNKLIGDSMDSNNYFVIYDVMLNFKKYGEKLANKIFDKFMENYDLELDQIKKDFERKYSKKMFQAIFSEISSFEGMYPTYGKLFKKIRKTVLKKIIDNWITV